VIKGRKEFVYVKQYNLLIELQKHWRAQRILLWLSALHHLLPDVATIHTFKHTSGHLG